MKRGARTALVWIALLGILFLAVFSSGRSSLPPISTSPSEALDALESGEVGSYRIDDGQLIIETTDHRLLSVRRPWDEVWRELVESGLPYDAMSHDLMGLIPYFLFGGIAILALIYFLRRLKGGAYHNIFELRKSKARHVDDHDKAKFSDIGGNHQAIELLGDIVEFLRAPERWTNAGLRIPRGILVVGPPGTGKTLLARAVAGETQSTFFYTSATEFVELFVGIGAARVRDTFEKALAKQPAIVFIDELDAIGRRRGSGIGTMHEEREQTLNQLLVLLDGMEQHKRLVVIAATNRPDILDAALLRSGRFDRVLRLELPTPAERLEILKIHTRNKPLDSTVSLEEVVRQTGGLSGADLEALTNAAGLHAARRTRQAAVGAEAALAAISISKDDFQAARNDLIKSNRQFDRLDSVIVESVSQFSEPTGPVRAKVTLDSGAVITGEVEWMNASHLKLKTEDGANIVVVKDNVSLIESLDSEALVSQADFAPDRWAGREIDTG